MAVFSGSFSVAIEAEIQTAVAFVLCFAFDRVPALLVG